MANEYGIGIEFFIWQYIDCYIIDIDFYNHIYLNPEDLKITAYSAKDMIRKKVYPDIKTLLKENCEDMYSEFSRLLKGTRPLKYLTFSNIKLSNSSQIYLDTNIYQASKLISKMQRLRSKVLTVWSEPNNKIIDKKQQKNSQ